MRHQHVTSKSHNLDSFYRDRRKKHKLHYERVRFRDSQRHIRANRQLGRVCTCNYVHVQLDHDSTNISHVGYKVEHAQGAHRHRPENHVGSINGSQYGWRHEVCPEVRPRNLAQHARGVETGILPSSESVVHWAEDWILKCHNANLQSYHTLGHRALVPIGLILQSLPGFYVCHRVTYGTSCSPPRVGLVSEANHKRCRAWSAQTHYHISGVLRWLNRCIQNLRASKKTATVNKATNSEPNGRS